MSHTPKLIMGDGNEYQYLYNPVDVTYNEIVAGAWVRRMNKSIARKHPKCTEQGFDFFMNLFNYCEE